MEGTCSPPLPDASDVRIFLKIFLTFWLTAVLIAAAVGWIGYQFRGQVETTLRQQLVQLMGARYELWRLLQAQGPEAARRALQASPYRDRLFLVDPAGQDVLGRPLPPALRERQQALRQALLNTRNWNLPPASNPRARGYHIVLAPPPHPFFALLAARPWLPLVALGLSALIAYALARHLARPIGRLRLAAGRLAQGQLAARAGPLPRRLHDELSELTADFDAMAARLESLVEAHRRLLQDVSHELRTPLARMRVALGLAERRGGGTAETARLEQEVDKLERLVEQVLTLAQLDAGGATQRTVWVDLPELLDMVVGDAAFEAGAQGKRVRLERAPGSATLPADDSLLRAALENVVRNALRHTPPDTTVDVILRLGPGDLEIAVRDSGAGVPEARLDDIFKPFVRIGEARDRQTGGYGLGLAIAARAIQVHGGQIRARNRPEGGLEVIIILPASAGV